MKRSTLLSLVGVAVIMLVIGTALGSVAFPTTETETTTQTIVSTITKSSHFVVYSATVTKEILQEQFQHLQVLTSGNCTLEGGVVTLEDTNTTEYLLPSQLYNMSENLTLVNVTFTTVTSSTGIVEITTVSFNISEYATQIILSTRMSGTETYVATATCPIVA